MVDRLRRIVELLRTHGSLSVAFLAGETGVTEQTIRRDLDRLAAQGQVIRSHGGATPPPSEPGDDCFTARLSQAADAKRRIAMAAVALVRPGEHIMLDAGTTTLAIARLLAGHDRIKVITNSVPVATEMAQRPASDIVLIGGELRVSTLSTVGPMARESFGRLHVQKLFLAASGIDAERGFTNSNLAEAEIKQAMIAAAEEVYAVADGSKLGRVLLYSFAAIEQVKALITTANAPHEALEAIRMRNVDVILV
ncbi:MAG: regulatory protein DeoR [Firmicutes bacterium]|nr:regulatory protein DeoR [Bacillota bacterium]